MERALQGDPVAFRRLVCLHGESLMALVRSFLGDAAESEDVAQEAFMAAWQGLAKLREPGRFAPWLHQIARNLCRRRLATRGRVPRMLSMQSDEAGSLLVRGAAVDETIVPESGETSPIVAALHSLPEEYAQVLHLRHIEGLGLDRIARLCDLSVSGVNTRLYRARKMLREKLARIER